ncbi:MAG: hypothetical protein ACRCWO_09105, partial [Bosea sp. (in: a-proteobacteria)]
NTRLVCRFSLPDQRQKLKPESFTGFKTCLILRDTARLNTDTEKQNPSACEMPANQGKISANTMKSCSRCSFCQFYGALGGTATL